MTTDNKAKKRISAPATVAGVLFLIFLLLVWVRVMCFDRVFYANEYSQLKTADYIGMSDESLGEATETLLDYLEGKRDDLVVTAEINGEQREVFNEREKAHMVDVRELYRGAMIAMWVCLGVSVLLFVGMFIRKKRSALLPTLRGYVAGNCIFLAIVAVLGGWAAIDFYAFWTSFHQLFFTNNLWLLDPNTDILIMMVPGQFFFDLVMRIVIGFVISAGVLLAASIIIIKKKKGRDELV